MNHPPHVVTDKQPWGLPSQPGIIPLRPLGLGDILDGAVRAIRFNPRTMLGLALAVSLVSTLLTLGIRLGFGVSVPALTGTTSPMSTVLDPGNIMGQFGGFLLTGLISCVVSEAVLGRRLSLSGAWHVVKGRLLPLVGFFLAAGLTVTILVITLIGVLALPLGIYLALVPPVLVLERQGLWAGVKRSVELVRGAYWRTLGIILIAGILVAIVGMMLTGPFLAALVILIGVSGIDPENLILASLVEAFAALFSGVLVTPFAASVTTLLYVDRRIRAEGLDLALMRHAGSAAAPNA